MASFGATVEQEGKPAESNPSGQDAAEKHASSGQQYSGMYSFLKEGEFVQVTVEDDGRVTGFISRYGDGDSDSHDARQHLTLRDQHANTLEDLFDFDHPPSLNTPVTTAAPPANDCTPQP